MQLNVAKVPSSTLAFTNCVYVHPSEVEALTPKNATSSPAPAQNYVLINDFVFMFKASKRVSKGTIALGEMQRRTAQLSLNQAVNCVPFVPTNENIFLASLKVEVDFLSKSSKRDTIEAHLLNEVLRREFLHQYFTLDQQFVADVAGSALKFVVLDLEVVDLRAISGETSNSDGEGKAAGKKARRGIMMKQTEIEFVKAADSKLNVAGASSKSGGGFFKAKDWNFQQMGIGGLDEEFSDIFRRAFASRVFPPAVVQKLGIKHVKGILLYGPPGTGKTLMARQIGKMLNGKEPKIVNGPEILNKYVGQSEENIRNLFVEAEQEYKERGDDSDLHIIIFDEIDAICPQRGSRTGGTGVADTVVNQLLAKIDGVEALNNILVIGMTNRYLSLFFLFLCFRFLFVSLSFTYETHRKDMMDEALLRPGRFEVHMEIGLPDEKGRLQIIRIHTAKMVENKYIGADVDLSELAALTKNFSGAEIEGLVKSATSFAFNRQVDVANPTKPIDPTKIKIMREDFLHALEEVRPAFGVSTQQFESCAPNGIIQYGASFMHVINAGKRFVQQVMNSNRTPLVSVLLEGSIGCGKTALAATLAMESGFPYVKLISPEELVAYAEAGKCSKIKKFFDDAYKSPHSVIVIDDIERLLEYVQIGPRFSNAVLQTLLVLLKKLPPPGRKLLILGTSSNRSVLKDMELESAFDAVLHVPDVCDGEEVRKVLQELNVFNAKDLDVIEKRFRGYVPIKKLLMIVEMARQSSSGVEDDGLVDRFFDCMADYGIGTPVIDDY
ncbi:transport between ER and Golgi ATPase protein [Balamuthia mandrillaris]